MMSPFIVKPVSSNEKIGQFSKNCCAYNLTESKSHIFVHMSVPYHFSLLCCPWTSHCDEAPVGVLILYSVMTCSIPTVGSLLCSISKQIEYENFSAQVYCSRPFLYQKNLQADILNIKTSQSRQTIFLDL
jgi:hypothetical protein